MTPEQEVAHREALRAALVKIAKIVDVCDCSDCRSITTIAEEALASMPVTAVGDVIVRPEAIGL